VSKFDVENRIEKSETASPLRTDRIMQLQSPTPSAVASDSIDKSLTATQSRTQLLTSRIEDMRDRSLLTEMKESETVEFADGLQMKLRMPSSEQSLYINEVSLVFIPISYIPSYNSHTFI